MIAAASVALRCAMVEAPEAAGLLMILQPAEAAGDSRLTGFSPAVASEQGLLACLAATAHLAGNRAAAELPPSSVSTAVMLGAEVVDVDCEFFLGIGDDVRDDFHLWLFFQCVRRLNHFLQSVVFWNLVTGRTDD